MTSARWRHGRWAGLIGSAALALLGAAGGAFAEGRNPLKIPDARYEQTTWAEVDGWADDDHDAAFAAFLISCKVIAGGSAPDANNRTMKAALYRVCQKAVDAKPQKPGEARDFFEQNFRPVRIAPAGTPDGFLTGYYEPIVEGTTQQTGNFEYPLYRKPPNLISGGHMQVVGDATGKKKKHRRRLVPFYDRSAIEDGALAGRHLEIAWLRDPIDSFFAHIQGSVRVLLDNGKLMRLNYQAANGHPYYAVGRWLIERNIVPKDEMSMDRIRQWMERNPEEGRELRRKNKSYVFFRETNLGDDQEPVGAQGISLTPGRSIAVDHKLHVYGTPFFISAMLPIESEKPETPFRRLMIAQDTGGAIVGPARADIYFGAGDEAGSVSGRLRHNGRFVMLVPKEIDPKQDNGDVPLPQPRPQIPVSEGKPAEPPPQTAVAPVVAAPDKPAAAEKPAADAKAAEKAPDKPAAKPSGKSAARTPEPAAKKPAEPAPKSAHAAKTDAADKKPKKKSEPAAVKTAAGKTGATKLDAWEARVMPVIPSVESGRTETAKHKSKKKE